MDMHDGFDKKSKLGVMEQQGYAGPWVYVFFAFSSVSFQVVIIYQLVQFLLPFSPFKFLSLFPFSLSLSLSFSFYFSGSSCPWDLEFFFFFFGLWDFSFV